jgi:hypothetical protein
MTRHLSGGIDPDTNEPIKYAVRSRRNAKTAQEPRPLGYGPTARLVRKLADAGRAVVAQPSNEKALADLSHVVVAIDTELERHEQRHQAAAEKRRATWNARKTEDKWLHRIVVNETLAAEDVTLAYAARAARLTFKTMYRYLNQGFGTGRKHAAQVERLHGRGVRVVLVERYLNPALAYNRAPDEPMKEELGTVHAQSKPRAKTRKSTHNDINHEEGTSADADEPND